jgi:hypothetical protein
MEPQNMSQGGDRSSCANVALYTTTTAQNDPLQQSNSSRRRRRRGMIYNNENVTDDHHEVRTDIGSHSHDRRNNPYWNSISYVTATFALGATFLFLSTVLSLDYLPDQWNIYDGRTSTARLKYQQRRLPQQSSSWYTSVHRFMWSLTDEEVQERIFERHDDEPPTRSAITPAPVLTTVPQPVVNTPTVKLPSSIAEPSIQTPTAPTNKITKAPAIVVSPTVPATILPTISAVPDGGAKVTTVPFGQVSPTKTPVIGGVTETPDSTGGSSKEPSAVVPTTMQSLSPVPSMIPAPSISGNETTIVPTITIPTLLPNSTMTTEAPSVMNGTSMSELPSLVPNLAVPTDPNQNETSRPPSTANETIVTDTPSLSPNVNSSVSLVPTPIESTQRYIERVLQLEADTLLEPNTYRNQAYTSLTETFPDLTPMNNNQLEIIQIYSLNTMYYTLNGTEWKQRTSWTTGPNEPCTNPVWYGVTCSTDGVITKLDLSNNDLLGTIPPDISGLSNLGELS